MPSTHALLSPSSSHRWLTCGPSARLESEFPSQDTAYTKEGTLAHAMAEATLTRFLQISPEGNFPAYATEFFIHINWERYKLDDRSHFPELFDLIDEADNNGFDGWEMLEIVYEGYISFVWDRFCELRGQNPDTQLLIEAQLKLDDYIPEGFGSSDAVIISGNSLHVFDLKYGKGVKVEAEDNPQMMCYALGALRGPGELSPIETVSMTIVQPRLHHISSSVFGASELLFWADQVLRPAAEKAYKGEGDFMPGGHCKFCKAKGLCRARADFALDAVKQCENATITDDELAELLGKIDTIADWCENIRETATAKMLAGVPLKGWKLVEGRSVRKITDEQGLVAMMCELGWDRSQCYEEKIKTISALEKMLGAKAKASINQYTSKSKGAPTIAPESDNRKEYSSAEADFA